YGGNNALDDPSYGLLAAENRIVAKQAAAAFDIDLVVPVDHDFADAAVCQQWFQRPQADGLVQHVATQRRTVDTGRDLCIAGGDTIKHVLRLAAQQAIAHAGHVAAAQIQRLQQCRMQPAAMRQQGLRCGPIRLLYRRRHGRGVGDSAWPVPVAGIAVQACVRQRHPDTAGADENVVAWQYGAMHSHAMAVDKRSPERPQVFEFDDLLVLYQPRVVLRDAPVGDAQPALRSAAYQQGRRRLDRFLLPIFKGDAEV